MIGAALNTGLPKEQDREIAIGTVVGASHLADRDCREVADLRKEVTSPNGTT